MRCQQVQSLTCCCYACPLLPACLFCPCSCTGFIIQLTTIVENRPKTCLKFYGRNDLGEFKRTFVRADISMLNDRQGMLI